MTSDKKFEEKYFSENTSGWQNICWVPIFLIFSSWTELSSVLNAGRRAVQGQLYGKNEEE